MKRWKCRKCWYVYDPRVGDPDGGIAPGTPFELIPDDWRCPVCGASKADFHVLSEPPPREPERPRPAAALPAPAAKAAPRADERSPQPPAPAPGQPRPELSRPPSAPPMTAPMWTVGSLKGLRQGHDKS